MLHTPGIVPDELSIAARTYKDALTIEQIEAMCRRAGKQITQYIQESGPMANVIDTILGDPQELSTAQNKTLKILNNEISGVIQEFIENQKEHFKQFSPQEVEKATTELSHYFTEELTLLVKLYLSRDFKSLVGKGAIESVDAIIAESNLLLQQNEKLNALRVENFRSSFQRALNGTEQLSQQTPTDKKNIEKTIAPSEDTALRVGAAVIASEIALTIYATQAGVASYHGSESALLEFLSKFPYLPGFILPILTNFCSQEFLKSFTAFTKDKKSLDNLRRTGLGLALATAIIGTGSFDYKNTRNLVETSAASGIGARETVTKLEEGVKTIEGTLEAQSSKAISTLSTTLDTLLKKEDEERGGKGKTYYAKKLIIEGSTGAGAGIYSENPLTWLNLESSKGVKLPIFGGEYAAFLKQLEALSYPENTRLETLLRNPTIGLKQKAEALSEEIHLRSLTQNIDILKNSINQLHDFGISSIVNVNNIHPITSFEGAQKAINTALKEIEVIETRAAKLQELSETLITVYKKSLLSVDQTAEHHFKILGNTKLMAPNLLPADTKIAIPTITKENNSELKKLGEIQPRNYNQAEAEKLVKDILRGNLSEMNTLIFSRAFGIILITLLPILGMLAFNLFNLKRSKNKAEFLRMRGELLKQIDKIIDTFHSVLNKEFAQFITDTTGTNTFSRAVSQQIIWEFLYSKEPKLSKNLNEIFDEEISFFNLEQKSHSQGSFMAALKRFISVDVKSEDHNTIYRLNRIFAERAKGSPIFNANELESFLAILGVKDLSQIKTGVEAFIKKAGDLEKSLQEEAERDITFKAALADANISKTELQNTELDSARYQLIIEQIRAYNEYAEVLSKKSYTGQEGITAEKIRNFIEGDIKNFTDSKTKEYTDVYATKDAEIRKKYKLDTTPLGRNINPLTLKVLWNEMKNISNPLTRLRTRKVDVFFKNTQGAKVSKIQPVGGYVNDEIYGKASNQKTELESALGDKTNFMEQLKNHSAAISFFQNADTNEIDDFVARQVAHIDDADRAKQYSEILMRAVLSSWDIEKYFTTMHVFQNFDDQMINLKLQMKTVESIDEAHRILFELGEVIKAKEEYLLSNSDGFLEWKEAFTILLRTLDGLKNLKKELVSNQDTLTAISHLAGAIKAVAEKKY